MASNFIIYEAVNKTNGKVYVGLTTKGLSSRKSSHIRSAKSGSKSYFHRAIRKYGEESFEWDVVLECSDKQSMYKLERICIGLYETWQTYNVSLGGEHSAYGMKHTQEVKDLCGAYAKVRWDGKRALDKYPEFVFRLNSYKEASGYGVPKTTWYRERKRLGL